MVYKVDRLSRSLLDFSRMMEVFDTKRLCGIVSLGDLAVKQSTKDCAAKALEEISEPAHAHHAA